MRTYDVTLYEKGFCENSTDTLRVTVEDDEHPRHKAVDLLCKLGWHVFREYVRVKKISRVYV